MLDFKIVVAIGEIYALSAFMIWGKDMITFVVSQLDTNGLYYFFSTIAQTLAGAIGFMAAFLTLRLLSLKEEMGFNGGEIVRGVERIEDINFARSERVAHLNRNELYDQMMREVSGLEWRFVAPRADDPQVEENIERLRVLSVFKRSLMAQFKFILVATISQILSSIGLIPFVNKNFKEEWMGTAVLLLAAFIIVYFIVYIRLIAFSMMPVPHPASN